MRYKLRKKNSEEPPVFEAFAYRSAPVRKRIHHFLFGTERRLVA